MDRFSIDLDAASSRLADIIGRYSPFLAEDRAGISTIFVPKTMRKLGEMNTLELLALVQARVLKRYPDPEGKGDLFLVRARHLKPTGKASASYGTGRTSLGLQVS